MATRPRKYASPLTAKINRDNWKEIIKPKDLSVDDLIALRWDMAEMQKLGKQLEGFLKVILIARLGDDMEYRNDAFELVRREQTRAGGLDTDRLREDYGDNWIAQYSKEPTTFETMTIRPVKKEA